LIGEELGGDTGQQRRSPAQAIEEDSEGHGPGDRHRQVTDEPEHDGERVEAGTIARSPRKGAAAPLMPNQTPAT
jgi:hypothetical protein